MQPVAVTKIVSMKSTTTLSSTTAYTTSLSTPRRTPKPGPKRSRQLKIRAETKREKARYCHATPLGSS